MAKTSSDTNRNELVELALAGIEAQIKDLSEKREELRRMLESGGTAAPRRAAKAGKAGRTSKAAKAAENGEPTGRKKRVFSPATRKKLREAAKARWARNKESKTE
ncbi:MAG: hypothetical protein EBU88_04120 [Acidobacteria bacterium]|nr:hypothetical protein [Acidobacteriota bacterium]